MAWVVTSAQGNCALTLAATEPRSAALATAASTVVISPEKFDKACATRSGMGCRGRFRLAG